MAYLLEGVPPPPGTRNDRRALRRLSGLLDSSRARLRLALFLSFAAAAFLAFVVSPSHRVFVEADGREQVVVSRNLATGELLKQAGVERSLNDIVVRDAAGLRVERALPAIVEVDGQTLAWRTRANTIGELLSEMEITIGPSDAIYYNGVEVHKDDPVGTSPMPALSPAILAAFGRTAVEPRGMALTIYRAIPFTLVEDGQQFVLKSSRPTIGLALHEAGIRLGPADEVYPLPSEALVAGQQVTIDHAFAVSIRLGESSQIIYTHKTVLKDALAEAGLALGPEDRVEPALDASVRNGMTARLVRVAGRALVERETITRRTVFKPDETLQGSNSRIVQGHDGVRLREYRIVIEDGVEKERKLVRDSFDPETLDTVIYYAASALRSTGLPTENLSVARTERMYVTWYNAASSGRPNTDPTYGITATGLPVTKGIVAVDPRVIPLGTRLYIPGYGFAVAADTGGAVVGNIIDLGFPDGVDPVWTTGHYDVFILTP